MMKNNPLIDNFTYQKTDKGIEITGVADFDNLVSSSSKKGLLIIPNQADLQKAGLITEDQRAEITPKGFQEIVEAGCYTDEIDAVAISNTDNKKLTYNSPSMYALFDSPDVRNYAGYIHGIYLNNLDTSQVVEMDSLFDGAMAEGITDLEISDWDVSNVKSMHSMFSYFQPGKAWREMYPTKPYEQTLDLSKWDVSNVTDMSRMFHNSDLDHIDITNWDTSHVTNMNGMFFECKTQREITGIEKLDTSNVKNMALMFSCISNTSDTNQQKLDLSKWNVGNVENMSYMFYNNQPIKEVDVSGWDVSHVTDMSGMFRAALHLEKITGLENWDVSKVKNMKGIFVDTKNIKELDLFKWKFNPECNLQGIMLGSGVRKIKTPEPAKPKTPNKITVKKPAKRSR